MLLYQVEVRSAAEYSLKSIFNIFNQRACIFLEDEEREYSKPNPYAIKKAMKVMNSKTAIYVGDSTEDLLMVRRAEKEADIKIAFFGVYGCSNVARINCKTIQKNWGRSDNRKCQQLTKHIK